MSGTAGRTPDGVFGECKAIRWASIFSAASVRRGCGARSVCVSIRPEALGACSSYDALNGSGTTHAMGVAIAQSPNSLPPGSLAFADLDSWYHLKLEGLTDGIIHQAPDL